MKGLALMAMASLAMAGAATTRSSFASPLDDLFGDTLRDADLFPHPFPNLIVERDGPEERARYREHLRAEAERQQPVIDAAAAKRERKRLKLARTVG